MEQPDPLLKWETCSTVGLDEWSISHEKSSHKLQNGNLDGEVEWANNSNWSEWPSVTCCVLSMMVSWNSERFSEEPHLISTEVLEEVSSDNNLSSSLGFTLWCTSLDAFDKEVEHFWIMKNLSSLSADISKHEIPLLVLEWVVHTMKGNRLESLNKWLGLMKLSIRN